VRFSPEAAAVVDAAGNLVGILTKSDIIRGFKTTFVHARQELKACLRPPPRDRGRERQGVYYLSQSGGGGHPPSEGRAGDRRRRGDFIPNCSVAEVLATGRAVRNHKNTINGVTYIAHASPIIDDNDIIGAVASFQPFSEIESLAGELDVVKRLYKELDAVVSCSYDGLMVTDGDGVIRKVNAATVKLLGLSPPKAAGEAAYEHHLG
jgi:PAS domain-containing protein